MAGSRPWALLALLVLALTGAVTADWWHPPARLQWQWQLSPFNFPADLVTGPDRVTLYDIDLFDNSADTIAKIKGSASPPGTIRVMCYFEAGTYVTDKVNNPYLSLYPAEAIGLPYEAPYTNERWLDIMHPQVREVTKKILDLAVTKGCDAVEPDNVQGFETDSGYKTGFYKCPKVTKLVNGVNKTTQTGYVTGCDLDYKEWRDFNLFLATEAHTRNLAIANKNNFYMAPELADTHDMELSEQCWQYAECGNYTAFTKRGKPVLQVEYRTSSTYYTRACTQWWPMGFSTLTKKATLTKNPRYACCGPALASNATCTPLCLAAGQDPATCIVG